MLGLQFWHLLLLFIHTVCTLTRVWQDQIPPSPLGGPAWWLSSPPPLLSFILVDICQFRDSTETSWERGGKERKEKEMKRTDIYPTNAPPHTWVSLCTRSILSFVCTGTFQLQLLPGNPSPLIRTPPWKTAQRSACVGICLLSSPLPFPPPPIVLSVGLPSGTSGGWGFPASGPLCWLHCCATSICHPLDGQTVSGQL